jgi:hypothetical protein
LEHAPRELGVRGEDKGEEDMNLNTIYFTSINCLRAEAIFGDTAELLYNGERVWEGVLNTNGLIQINSRGYKVPGGAGGNVTINQWYVGQPKEPVFTQQVLQTDDRRELGATWKVEEFYDGDPGGVYDLNFRTTLEPWEGGREVTPTPPGKP